jgi:hypothetical protein
MHEMTSSDDRRLLSRAASRWRWAALAAAVLCALAIAARVMAFPLQHDEQFYVSAGALFSFDGLYDGLGFSHLPNLPILLSAIYQVTGTDHYLFFGRLVIVAGWGAALWAMWLIGRDYARSTLAAVALVALLAFNAALLDQTGMTVTNNFLPVPFMLGGLYCFFRAVDRPLPSIALAAASGLLLACAAGLKANYAVLIAPVALAALIAPVGGGFGARVSRLILPMVAGGLVGLGPTLWFFASDPAGFIAHNVAFHRGPQLHYWARYADPAAPQVIGLRDKLLLARSQWFSGTTLVTAVAIVALALAAGRRLRDWRIMLVTAILALAVAISFLPTPAFPQYYTITIPFAVLLLGLIAGALDDERRAAARPVLIAAIAVSGLIAAPVLLAALPALAKPKKVTGLRVHRDGAVIAALARADGRSGRIATLGPLHALEGGMPVYPGLALGPFVYRAVEWVPPAEQRYYRNAVTPTTVGAMLDRDPPAAVVVGYEGPLDRPLADWALAHGYRPTRIALRNSGDADHAIVLVAPKAAGVSAPRAAPSTPAIPATAAQRR